MVAVLLYSQVSGQLRWRLRRGGVRAERRSQIFRDLIGDLGPDSGDAAQPHDIDLVFPSVHVMTAYGADLAEGVAVKALLDQNILTVAQRLRNKGAGLVFRELTPLDRIVLHGEVETQAAAVHQGHVPPPDGIAPVANPRRPNLVGAGIKLVGPVSSPAIREHHYGHLGFYVLDAHERSPERRAVRPRDNPGDGRRPSGGRRRHQQNGSETDTESPSHGVPPTAPDFLQSDRQFLASSMTGLFSRRKMPVCTRRMQARLTGDGGEVVRFHPVQLGEAIKR